MQRLNAITSFIENDFPVNGAYFDLNTMAVTKALLDSGGLKQKTPTLPRSDCVEIAKYDLPLSIYEFSDTNSVDEVFRRINSGGKKLSRQELRAAGSTGHFGEAVRKISAKVRGDDSYSDILLLDRMKRISITNRDLDYGIAADEVFWVSQGILTKDQLRQSRDEELVADMLAFMVSEDPPSSRTEFLDDFFGLGEDDASISRHTQIETAVQKRGTDLVVSDFQRTLDQLRLLLSAAGTSFGGLLFKEKPARAPRYFQAVFLAFHKLVVKEGLELKDPSKLADVLSDSARRIPVPEGGRWGGEDRQNTVNSVAGMCKDSFGHIAHADPAHVHWITQLQNILTQSYTEQSAYDFKQGFFRLDGEGHFDEPSFEKILQTCVAIANQKKGAKGYVLVGVAENEATAGRVKEMFSVAPRVYESFYITGVDHEAQALGKSMDQLFQLIVDKVRHSKLSDDLKDFLSRNIKPVRYYDKTIFVFEVAGQEDPSSYGDQYFVRRGAQLDEVPVSELPKLIRRYIA
ncbi:hypothetical protein GCM10011297_29930 [Bacterioplanes sanyensis]|nr:hypothetical protein GCM10011297_29930 [Bacterioplanes sanyensis]